MYHCVMYRFVMYHFVSALCDDTLPDVTFLGDTFCDIRNKRDNNYGSKSPPEPGTAGLQRLGGDSTTSQQQAARPAFYQGSRQHPQAAVYIHED